MKKVYSVLIHQVCDGSEIGMKVKVFGNYSKAREEFDALVEDEKEYAKKRGWTVNTTVRINGECDYLAQQPFGYTENHTVIELKEHNV